MTHASLRAGALTLIALLAVACAAGGPGGADPQRAFEVVGGVEAWSAVLGGVSSLPLPSGAVPQPCPAPQGKA